MPEVSAWRLFAEAHRAATAVAMLAALGFAMVPAAQLTNGLGGFNHDASTPLARTIPAVLAIVVVAAVLPRYRDAELLATRRVVVARRILLASLTTCAVLIAALAAILGDLAAGLPVGLYAVAPARGVIAWIALGILATVLFGPGRGWLGIGVGVALTVFYGYNWDAQPRFWNILAADIRDTLTWLFTAGLVVAAMIAARIAPERSGLA